MGGKEMEAQRVLRGRESGNGVVAGEELHSKGVV